MSSEDINSKSNSETINITLRNKDNDSSSSQNPEAISYILGLNEKLLQENQHLIAEISRIKKDLEEKDNELEEKDDEIGREEKSNNHLKCLLKNFLEMNKYYQKITENTEIISNRNYDYLKKFKNKFSEIKYIITGIYAIILSFSLIFSSFFAGCILFVYAFAPLITIEYYITIFELPNSETEKETIKITNNNIKELEASQDYIHEFINNI